MKKLNLFLIPVIFLSCINIYLEPAYTVSELSELEKEIKMISPQEKLKENSLGYGFGIGVFEPSKYFLRFRFEQKKFQSQSSSHFYLNSGIFEGGINLLRSRKLGIFPVVGIGMNHNEVIVNSLNYSGYSYPLITSGIEFNYNFTEGLPGYFAIYFRISGFYSNGNFLDTQDMEDFIILDPLKGLSFSAGISMGYIPEK